MQKDFALAVTCNFKVKTLGPNREHKACGLEVRFRIRQKVGFRGPWCTEHGHHDRLHGWAPAYGR
ncbi:hypothetical protein OAV87_03170, partial [Verrucomicrobiales bacterium]|nr:hypothetical protein [Verrucomicrobiales bacterium]